jgi:hypothetical protein
VRKREDGTEAEQRLLYFSPSVVPYNWEPVWAWCVSRREAEARAARERAERMAERRPRGRGTPNGAALRFLSGDMSDGWKHHSVPSAVASMRACGWSEAETMAVFSPYNDSIRRFAKNAWSWLEKSGPAGGWYRR